MIPSTRERIVRGAEAIFIREGCSRVTMEDIADFLKISKKTIYNHFQNKADLIFSVVSSTMKEILDTLEEIASDPHLDFTGRLKAILEYSFSQISHRGNLIMDNAAGFTFEESEHPGELMRKKILELAERLFREGIDEGMIRGDVAADFIPFFYLNVIDGCIKIYRDNNISIRKDDLFHEALKITFEGVLSDTGRCRFNSCAPVENETPSHP